MTAAKPRSWRKILLMQSKSKLLFSPLARLGLIRRKECWRITLRGWLLFGMLSGMAALFGVHGIFPFLALNRPVNAEILVVEGWLPDYLIQEIRSEFGKGGYRLLVTTGGPIIKGEIFAEFKTYAELMGAIFRKSGFDDKSVVAVPAEEAFKDRTYASALALRRWMSDSGMAARSVTVFSRGAHARRTRLLYDFAFQGKAEIGVIAGEDLRYDGKNWWKTSEGVRDILDETIAYLYARLLFHP
jgi:hypothetical protein